MEHVTKAILLQSSGVQRLKNSVLSQLALPIDPSLRVTAFLFFQNQVVEANQTQGLVGLPKLQHKEKNTPHQTEYLPGKDKLKINFHLLSPRNVGVFW